MIYTRFYLENRYRTKSGKHVLLLLLINKSDVVTISTKIRLAPNEWDGTKIVRRNDASQLNAVISKFKSDVDTKILAMSLEHDLESMRMSELKSLLRSAEKRTTKRNILFSDVVRQYMNNDLSEGTLEIYKTVLAKVTAFSGANTRMADITYKYLVDFNNFLSQGQGVNGRAIYLRHLRAICNYALHADIITKTPFENFKIKQEETQHKVIDIETLRGFYNHPVTKSQERFKDYFFLMLFLIGINAKDLLLAKHTDVVNGRLEYIRAKTHKKYSIKIEPEAWALLDKYKGKKYLVDAMDTCKEVKNFRHMMNRALRSIGNVVEVTYPADDLFSEPHIDKVLQPLISDIDTYYARHTWATLASDLEIPIDVISQALGHSFGNRTTMIYVKLDQQKVDDANRKVIDYLLKNSGSKSPTYSHRNATS